MGNCSRCWRAKSQARVGAAAGGQEAFLEGCVRLVGGDDQILFDGGGGGDLLEGTLLLVQRAHVGHHETGAQNRLLDRVPDGVLRVVKLHGHPAPRLEHAVELPKARLHNRLVFGQTLALALVDDGLGLAVGQHLQPGFPEEVEFGVHQVGAEGRVDMKM
jgi:hypothetical protein